MKAELKSSTDKPRSSTEIYTQSGATSTKLFFIFNSKDVINHMMSDDKDIQWLPEEQSVDLTHETTQQEIPLITNSGDLSLTEAGPAHTGTLVIFTGHRCPTIDCRQTRKIDSSDEGIFFLVPLNKNATHQEISQQATLYFHAYSRFLGTASLGPSPRPGGVGVDYGEPVLLTVVGSIAKGTVTGEMRLLSEDTQHRWKIVSGYKLVYSTNCHAMEGQELDPYEKQLLAEFESCDQEQKGCLNWDGLEQLCEKLQLEEQGLELMEYLLGTTGRASDKRVTFTEFQREVSPKFVFGQKKYGRRSRPESTELDEENSEDNPEDSDSEIIVSVDGEHNEIFMELALVCQAVGMEKMAEEIVQQLFEKLNVDADGRISFEAFLQLLISGESVIEMWEAAGVPGPSRLLQDLGYSDTRQVSLSELSAILDEELCNLNEDKRNEGLPVMSSPHEMSSLEHMRAERDKLRADILEANQRASLLAQEVDDHHARLEKSTQTQVRLLEQRHAQYTKQLTEQLTLEREQLAVQNQSLEKQLATLQEEEFRLRTDLNASRSENESLEHENHNLSEQLTLSQEVRTQLQKQVEDMQQWLDQVKIEIVKILTEKKACSRENCVLKNHISELRNKFPIHSVSNLVKTNSLTSSEEGSELCKESILVDQVQFITNETNFTKADKSTVTEEVRELTERLNVAEQSHAEVLLRCKDLESSLELLRQDVRTTGRGNWTRNGDCFDQEQAMTDDKFTELLSKIREYEEMFGSHDNHSDDSDRLSTIEERVSLEKQVTDLEEEYEELRRKAEQEQRDREQELETLRHKLQSLENKTGSRQDVSVQVSELDNGSWESDRTYIVEVNGIRKAVPNGRRDASRMVTASQACQIDLNVLQTLNSRLRHQEQQCRQLQAALKLQQQQSDSLLKRTWQQQKEELAALRFVLHSTQEKLQQQTVTCNEQEVVFHVQHFLLMSSNRTKPRSGDWAVAIEFIQDVAITSLSSGSNNISLSVDHYNCCIMQIGPPSYSHISLHKQQYITSKPKLILTVFGLFMVPSRDLFFFLQRVFMLTAWWLHLDVDNFLSKSFIGSDYLIGWHSQVIKYTDCVEFIVSKCDIEKQVITKTFLNEGRFWGKNLGVVEYYISLARGMQKVRLSFGEE
uniref:EF-hand domain-containing protein n=1 Tax=Timema genevievae TaxID=629358 RepID=A0A7R9JNX1_TIMGE|nr:unnamed protein product [Timema genevievae]